tara:strand:- start:389 stop:1531 length:1143 start_codon:yes stop_codon:yes gene_type:complete
MNIGYVTTVSGLNKIIQLQNIRNIFFNQTSITIGYVGGQANSRPQSENLVITYSQSDYTIDLIKTLFYQWLENSLVANSIEYLNDYLPSLEVLDVGLFNNQSFGTYIAAATEALACVASPTDQIRLDYDSALGTPPINTFVYTVTVTSNVVAPIADGTYSLLINSVTYFAEIVSSRIATIVVCPFLLDFIYDPNLQADNVANADNFIGFQINGSPGCYYGSTSVGGPTPGTNLNYSISCGNSISASSGIWPSGLVYNGNLTAANGLGQLPAFGIVLQNSSTTSFQSATVFYSVDYYIDPATATWIAFDINQIDGIPGFGNGTSNPFPCSGEPPFLGWYLRGELRIPGGTSLLNPAQTLSSALVEIFAGNQVGMVSQSPCV